MRLVKIPLAPFTRPTGFYEQECVCQSPMYDEWEDDCQCNGNAYVKITMYPSQRKSSEDDRIKEHAHYLIRAKTTFYAGQFTKQWFGWSLYAGSHCIPLNSIKEL